MSKMREKESPECVYLSIKNLRASRALCEPWTPAAASSTKATFGLRSLGQLGKIPDPHLVYGV